MHPLARVSVLVCTPVRGGLSPSYKMSTRALEEWCRTEGIHYDERFAAEAPVEVARDLLAAEFLAAQTPLGRPYSHCLMIDAGIGFSVETIRKLLLADVDFAAAAAPLRQTRIDEAIARGEARFAAAFAVPLTRETRETGRMKLASKGGGPFAQVNGIGGALMCLKQKVFMRMFDAYPELNHTTGFAYFQPTNLTEDGASHATLMREALAEMSRHSTASVDELRTIARRALAVATTDAPPMERCGEDISFCRRWRALHTAERPAEIWLLTDAALAHEGHGRWQGNFSDAFT